MICHCALDGGLGRLNHSGADIGVSIYSPPADTVNTAAAVAPAIVAAAGLAGFVALPPYWRADLLMERPSDVFKRRAQRRGVTVAIRSEYGRPSSYWRLAR